MERPFLNLSHQPLPQARNCCRQFDLQRIASTDAASESQQHASVLAISTTVSCADLPKRCKQSRTALQLHTGHIGLCHVIFQCQHVSEDAPKSRTIGISKPGGAPSHSSKSCTLNTEALFRHVQDCYWEKETIEHVECITGSCWQNDAGPRCKSRMQWVGQHPQAKVCSW